jgi:hypothetical protein
MAMNTCTNIHGAESVNITASILPVTGTGNITLTFTANNGEERAYIEIYTKEDLKALVTKLAEQLTQLSKAL